MFAFQIEIDASDAIKDMIRLGMAIDTGSLGAFMSTIADEHIKLRIENRFSSEGDDASGKWKELGWVTNEFRSNQGFQREHPINERTGELKEWILEDDPDISIMAYGGIQGTWPGEQPTGWLFKKFKTAQQGDERTQARPILAMDVTDLLAIQSALGAWIAGVTGMTFT